MTPYSEYSGSAEYLHLLSAPMWESLRPRLTAALKDVDPAAGPILELGAGTGLGTDVLLDAVPNDVLAAEPSAQLRGILLARLADRGATRVTVHPGGAADVPLPDHLAAVVGMHMVGHLAPELRRRLWTELATRLAPGGPVVLTVQPPDSVAPVPLFPWFGVTIGGLTYEGRGEAEPAGAESVRWLMSYRTRAGDTVLAEAAADYRWWVLSAPALAAELTAAGLEADVDGDLVIARAPHAPGAIENHVHKGLTGAVPDTPLLSGIHGGAAREPGRGRRAAQVADLVRLHLGLPDAAVTVSQLACRESGCPPLETVIAVLEKPSRRWTIHRPLAEIDDELVVGVLTHDPYGDHHG